MGHARSVSCECRFDNCQPAIFSCCLCVRILSRRAEKASGKGDRCSARVKKCCSTFEWFRTARERERPWRDITLRSPAWRSRGREGLLLNVVAVHLCGWRRLAIGGGDRRSWSWAGLKCHWTIVECRQLMIACRLLQQQSRVRNNWPWTSFPRRGKSFRNVFAAAGMCTCMSGLANQSHRAVTLKMFCDQIIPVPCSADRPNLQILRAISL